MDTLKDIWASLIAGVRDRTTNPLSVAFVISWCLWNYKFFIVIFGNDSTAVRLKLLEEMYPHVSETYMGAVLLYPVLSAFAYVFLYPVVGMAAVWVYRKYQVTTANLVKNAEQARTITPQERDALVRAHEKEMKRVTAEKDDFSAQLNALRATLSDTQEQLERAQAAAHLSAKEVKVRSSPSLTEVIKAQREGDTESIGASSDSLELGDVRADIILQLSQHTMPISLEVISGNLKLNPTVAKGALRQLSSMSVVSKDANGYWQLTALGEGLALKLLEEHKP